MPARMARLETADAQKYLTQLCKHFGHKVEVAQDGPHGRVTLPPGPAELDADAAGLTMVVRADDEAGLDRAAGIIESHLLRFAFRENVETLDWRAAEGVAQA